MGFIDKFLNSMNLGNDDDDYYDDEDDYFDDEDDFEDEKPRRRRPFRTEVFPL